MKMTFTLELAGDDAVCFHRFAHENNVSMEDLLQDFITNLIDGSQAGGSDEVDLARQYFDRCGYRYMRDRTFLAWALQEDGLDTITEALEAKQYATEELEEVINDPDFADVVKDLQEAIVNAQRNIEAEHGQYVKDCGRRHETAQDLQTGLAGIDAFLQEQGRLKEGRRRA